LLSMCGRVIQSSGPIKYGLVDGMDARDTRVHNYPARWNAAPSQDLLVIRRNHETNQISLDALRWGLIPYWCKDPKGGRRPINAKCETVRTLPTFRDAYRKRRCVIPVDAGSEMRESLGTAVFFAWGYCLRSAHAGVLHDRAAHIAQAGRSRRAWTDRGGTVIRRHACSLKTDYGSWACRPLRRLAQPAPGYENVIL
jgi:SOS response associated peptidase (SRAP)